MAREIHRKSVAIPHPRARTIRNETIRNLKTKERQQRRRVKSGAGKCCWNSCPCPVDGLLTPRSTCGRRATTCQLELVSQHRTNSTPLVVKPRRVAKSERSTSPCCAPFSCALCVANAHHRRALLCHSPTPCCAPKVPIDHRHNPSPPRSPVDGVWTALRPDVRKRRRAGPHLA